MLVIPAIDISEGRCVRLKQGDMGQKTVFADSPVEVAQQWASQGAEVLHIIDLDGAITGASANLEATSQILNVIDIPIELGGGLRIRDDVARVLDLGVRWAIMGTTALADRAEFQKCLAEFGDRIIVGIDARDGRVALQGWTETSEVLATRLATEMEDIGVARMIFTDIATDGMLAGPNVAGTQSIAEAVSVPIIASGGVTSLDDIRKLRMIEHLGVVGCIVGRALYSGTISLSEAISVTMD